MSEEESEEPGGASSPREQRPQVKGQRRSFGNIRRELSDEELSSSGVQKMLLDDLERLEADVAEWKSLGLQFHASDKRVGILEEKFKAHTGLEVISTGAVTVGSVFWGLTYSAWDNQPYGYMLLVCGTVLVASGIFAKKIKL